MKNFKGYPLFNDMKDIGMQAYNRLKTMSNINEAMGTEQATHYVDSFSDEEKKSLALMAKWIGKDGEATVQRKLRGE